MNKREEIIKYRFQDPQRAYGLCCELLERGIQSGNDYEVAYAYLYMGDTLFSMGKTEEALSSLRKAETIQKENGFEHLLMSTYNIIGIIYSNLGDALLALDSYHAGLRLAEKTKNETLQAILYCNIGSLLSDIGDPAEAAEYYKKAYGRCQRKEKEDGEVLFDIFLLYVNICETYMKEGRYRYAKSYMDDALSSIRKEQLTIRDEILVIRTYAVLFYHLKDYRKAYEMCQKAIQIGFQTWQDGEIFEVYICIAEVMIGMGKIKEVQSLLKELEMHAEHTDIHNRRLEVCKLWIEIYQKAGEDDLLAQQLEQYYELRKKRNMDRNKIIISAINNRCRLEEEKRQNQILNEKNKQLVKESELDELTSIYNRLGFCRRYEKLYDYARKNHSTYCLGIFDIDYFKNYNDAYGHLEGDACLKRVAQIFRETSDGTFCIGRYGGDEFVFMAYGVDEETIRDFLSRLVRNIQKEGIPFPEHPESDYVTISVGAILRECTCNIEFSTFLKDADRVLYEVKQSGKNGYKINSLIQ